MSAEDANLPTISLVVPSFNAAGTIGRALDSVVGQAYPRLELICVDGQSSDDTLEVIEHYSADLAALICEPDRCQAEALNKGFARATGDVYGWLCADDALLPGALHRVGSAFAADPCLEVLTGGCIREFDSGDRVETSPGDDFFDKLFLKNTVEQPSTFWRAAVHARTGPLSESLKYAFDWEYWCRMKRAGFAFAAVPEPLSVYYFSTSNLTSTGGTRIAREMYRIVREFGPYGGRLAWAYAFLYRVFDLRGFYDADETKGRLSTLVFHMALRGLYHLFDRESINTYNWNFASRQERGKGW